MLGYGWAIAIPVAWVLAITTFFHWIGRVSPIATDLPIFVATGMLPYLVFRQAVSALMQVCRNERHLLTFGPAEPEDLFLAASLAEMMNAALVAAAVLAILAITSSVPVPADPLRAVFGFALAWGLGASVGRFAAVASAISDTAHRLVPILLRPFFWISGIFFVAAELPGAVLGYLWWNPLLHVTEILRSGYFGTYDSAVASPTVPLATIALFYVGSRVLAASPLVGDQGLVRT